MTAVATGAGRAWVKPRRRLILWVSLGAAAVVAALIGVFASAPQGSVQVRSPLLGHSAPTLSGAVINGGGQASLSAEQGKWVLVNFFASWCGPCQEEMPQLLAFQSQHAAAAADATIFGVEYDQSDVGSARSYLDGQKATWPVVTDGSADVRWGVQGIPESYLVAPDGLVVAKYAGDITASSLDAQIAKLGGTTAGATG